jgi:hypothetical protein
MRAIGYTWEWGQPTAAFYCVTNTQKGLEKGMVDCNRYLIDKLNEAEARQEVHWSAGWFPYPAGLTGPNDELGAAWEAEAKTLHAITEAMNPADPSNEAQYAEYSRNYGPVQNMQSLSATKHTRQRHMHKKTSRRQLIFITYIALLSANRSTFANEVASEGNMGEAEPTYGSNGILLTNFERYWPKGQTIPKIIYELAELIKPWPWGVLSHVYITASRPNDYGYENGTDLWNQLGMFIGSANAGHTEIAGKAYSEIS